MDDNAIFFGLSDQLNTPPPPLWIILKSRGPSSRLSATERIKSQRKEILHGILGRLGEEVSVGSRSRKGRGKERPAGPNATLLEDFPLGNCASRSMQRRHFSMSDMVKYCDENAMGRSTLESTADEDFRFNNSRRRFSLRFFMPELASPSKQKGSEWSNHSADSTFRAKKAFSVLKRKENRGGSLIGYFEDVGGSNPSQSNAAAHDATTLLEDFPLNNATSRSIQRRHFSMTDMVNYCDENARGRSTLESTLNEDFGFDSGRGQFIRRCSVPKMAGRGKRKGLESPNHRTNSIFHAKKAFFVPERKESRGSSLTGDSEDANGSNLSKSNTGAHDATTLLEDFPLKNDASSSIQRRHSSMSDMVKYCDEAGEFDLSKSNASTPNTTSLLEDFPLDNSASRSIQRRCSSMSDMVKSCDENTMVADLITLKLKVAELQSELQIAKNQGQGQAAKSQSLQEAQESIRELKERNAQLEEENFMLLRLLANLERLGMLNGAEEELTAVKDMRCRPRMNQDDGGLEEEEHEWTRPANAFKGVDDHRIPSPNGNDGIPHERKKEKEEQRPMATAAAGHGHGTCSDGLSYEDLLEAAVNPNEGNRKFDRRGSGSEAGSSSQLNSAGPLGNFAVNKTHDGRKFQFVGGPNTPNRKSMVSAGSSEETWYFEEKIDEDCHPEKQHWDPSEYAFSSIGSTTSCK